MSAPSPNSESLSAAFLDALQDELVDYPQTTATRGVHYAAQGRVGPVEYLPDRVMAAVRGTRVYATSWSLEDGESCRPQCTCFAGPYCKHSYALAHRVLVACGRAQPFENGRRREGAPAPRPAARPRPLREPTTPIERLRAAQTIWEREYAISDMLIAAPVAGLSGYGHHFRHLLEETDPDLLCWRLADAVAGLAQGWVPDELAAYRERPDLAERFAERARAGLAQDLLRWAAKGMEPRRRSLRIELKLSRSPSDHARLELLTRITSPRLNDELRSGAQLATVQSEVRSSSSSMRAEERILLDWLVRQHRLGNYYGDSLPLSGDDIRDLLAHVTDPSLVTWSDDLDRELAARGNVQPGSPLRVGPDLARLVPAVTTGGPSPIVHLVVRWPDGRQLPPEKVLHLGNQPLDEASSYILAEGVLSPMASDVPFLLQERFQTAGSLPVQATDRELVLKALAGRYAHVRETISDHTRVYAVAPMAALDLRDDDWLRVRVFARARGLEWHPGASIEPGAVVFEFGPEGTWSRLGGAPPADAEKYDSIEVPIEAPPAAAVDTSNDEIAQPWLEVPDPEAVAPILEWLRRISASPGRRKLAGGNACPWPDAETGWWLRVNKRRMPAFTAAWEERPRGIQYYGTGRLRRLLLGLDRVVPRLRVESSGVDFFRVSAEWEAEGLHLSHSDLEKLREADTRFVKLSGGWVQRDVALEQEAVLDTLADIGIDPFAGPANVSLLQLAGARPQSLAALQTYGADPDAIAAAQELRRQVAAFEGIPRIPLPPELQAELRPYQRDGLDFLAYTASLGAGAILADDMGLGKTVQALAWIAHIRTIEPDQGPVLVVCPASVVHNWAEEAARFTPSLRVLLLTSGATRHELRADIPEYDVVVTNYALLRRDASHWTQIRLHAAILDEAQNIKNPGAAVTRAAAELQARHRLALTGTPLENRALDLWSIANFTSPGYLGSRTSFGALYDKTDAPRHLRTLLATRLRPILLRRTKAQVAQDLPPRIEETQHCELTAGQRHLYLAELRQARRAVEKLERETGGIARNQITILALLTRLRQICCHPALAGGKAGLGSGKFTALIELLEPLLAEGHKVLVFSQFVQCIKLLQAELRRHGITFHTLTGETTKRGEVVHAFQEDPDPCVFLLSLKAGGTGLNLTAASYVVLFDPWWNPAVEAQAIDRTHRIGQTRTVIAYRLLAYGTIEEKIWELQKRKAELASDILGQDGFAQALSREDLQFLLEEAQE